MGSLLLAGCQTAPPIVLRNSDLVRELFYPPAVPRGELKPDTEGGAVDHSDYAAYLSQILKADGTVNYARAKQLESQLNAYLVTIGDVELKSLSYYEQLALLLNAYNAFTIKMILENPGVRSPLDVPAARGWTHPAWLIDRHATKLEELEHRYIRERFTDARVHFALCRGTLGGAPLRAEPYTGARLVEQMNDQAHRMMADPRHMQWVPDRALLRINYLFDRYRSDFADNDLDLIRALVHWLPDPVVEALKANSIVRIEYISYDWRLNGNW